ncbi:hypothetical protein Tco_1060853 [Tanacetum coccineum]
MDNEHHRHNGYTINQLNVNKQQGTKAKRNSGVGDAEDRRKISNRKYYLRHNHPEVFSDEGGSDHINGASNLNISNRVPFGMLENTIRNESPQYGRFMNSNETVVTTCLSPFEECTVASNKENIVSSGRCMFNQTGIERFSGKITFVELSLNDEGCSTAMNVEVNMDGSTSLVSDETLVTDKDCSESIQAEDGVLPSYDNDIDIPIADTDEVVIADVPEDKRKERNRNYYTRNILVNRENGVGCSNETLVIDEDCDESSDVVSEIYEYDLDLGLEDIDESGFFMPDSSDIRFENGVLEEDPYDFVYDGLPSQCHVLKDPRFCVKCGAKKFEFEYPTLCCMGGKTKLVDPDIPPDLYNMFISQCDVGKRFRRSIRAYNTNFSFASMGVQLDESVSNMRSGVYTFRAHGGIYHKIDQLVLRDGKPRYLQLYFYDDDEELQHRLSWNNLDEDIVRRLTSVLAKNPYVQTFRSLRELCPLDNYRVGLKKDLRLDQRLYNRPTTSEVVIQIF